MIPLIILAIEDPDDREFMAKLYLNYQRLMFSVAVKILKDEWAAEDIVQTAVEKLIDKIDDLREKDEIPLVNYIYATCRNLSITYKKKAERISGYAISEDDNSVDADVPPEDWIIERETLELVDIAWKLVDEQTRQVLRSKFVLEMSDAEIAADLGIKPNSVRTYVGRARNKLRDKIQELEK